MPSKHETGICKLPCRMSVEDVVARLTGVLADRGITLFALVDHSGEAKKVGLTMPDTKLLIFGSPTAGTAVMLAAPSSALDLPLKILVHEDHEGQAWITYNDPSYLQRRHGIPEDLLPVLKSVEALANKASE